MTSEQEKLFKDWQDASRAFNDKFWEYIVVDIAIPGNPARTPDKPLTKYAIKKLDDLEKKMHEKWDLWLRSLGL
jgi:hypothetical protein